MRPHRIPRSTAFLASAAALALAGASAPATAAPGVPIGTGAASITAQTIPQLLAVRAAHHTGFDRVVFEFSGAGPTSASVKYVTRLIADPSGKTVRVPGRAILAVVMHGVDAHNGSGAATVPTRVAYALPNVITTVKAGDFEAVVSYGIGLSVKTSVHTHWLNSPRRLVVDIATPYSTVTRRVYFADAHKIAANINPPVTWVNRPVPAGAPATAVMDRLYAGPTPVEKTRGLSLVPSHSTGYTKLRISTTKVARVQLTGACSSDGSAVITVATEITPTLRQFASVDWVKIYDSLGSTEYPGGLRDSIPVCLEP